MPRERVVNNTEILLNIHDNIKNGNQRKVSYIYKETG